MKRTVKPLVWLALLAPLAWLAWLGFNSGLGANPIEFINRYLGEWALRILLLALAVTPFAGISGRKGVMRLRRLIGLFAFFYVCLHLLSYLGFDQHFDWSAIWKDIVKRWYITVGMTGFLALLALAATSTRAAVKRLGGRNWVRLHKLAYFAGAAGCLHFFMMRKGFQLEPVYYAGVLAVLLGYRGVVWGRNRMLRAAT